MGALPYMAARAPAFRALTLNRRLRRVDNLKVMLQRVLEASYFLERLSNEIARAARYERVFSLVLFRPPANVADAERSLLLDWGAAVGRSHVRTCDIVGILPDEALFAIILPETGATGAMVVRERFTSLDRLAARRGVEVEPWASESFSYPEAARVIEAFLALRADLMNPLSIASR